ncbi:MAG TPA: GAF domain-containing SpoIIE family protein phosphatase [Candidatus Kapabacteria bacterium]|nr:GAF domain-containing SpoIIE family protein phosphatase [Candidatus Kapabacteria bacterium]
MPTRTQRFEAYVAELPHFSLPTALAVLGASWGALGLYDLVFGGYESATPYEFDLLRVLIPLVGLAPMVIRLLQPKDVVDDNEAYGTFLRMTTMALLLAAAMTLLRVIPFSFTPEGIAESVWSFMVGRGAALLPLLAVPAIAEQLVRLLRYRSRRSVPRSAVIFTYAMIVGLVVGQVVPLSAAFDPDVPTPALALTPLLGMIALVLTARARWIVNLRKRQKLVVLGLSFIGMPIAMALITLVGDSELAKAVMSMSVGLATLSHGTGVALACVQLSLFVHALIALPTAEAIDRRNTEVSSLATFGRLLTRSFDMTDLIETSIGVACDVTASRAAWVELESGETRDLLLGASPRLTAAEALRLMSAQTPEGLTLAELVATRAGVQVVDRAEPLTAAPIASRPLAAGAAGAGTSGESKEKKAEKHKGPPALSTVAAAPLLAGDVRLGTLYVAKERAREFDREDLRILKTVADQIAMAMQHSQLISSSIEREKIEQEMMIARDLQQRLLPRSMPVSPWYDIDAESRPAHLVGGDYYDLVSFSDGTLGAVIADVSGKGPSAALYMGMIKGVIQALSGSTATPAELLAKINVALHGHIDQRWFATMTCAQIFEEQRMLRIARAGHCPTLVVRNGVGEYRRSRGIGLSIARPLMFERNLELEELHFAPDDYVVLLSDGLPEARSPEGEEYGYERLLATVTAAAAHQPSPAELRNTIFNELSAFVRGELPADDSTLLVLRWKPCTEPGAST